MDVLGDTYLAYLTDHLRAIREEINKSASSVEVDMNDMTHLNSLLQHVTQPLITVRDRKVAAREIIHQAYFDGMECLEADGDCCADLFRLWPEHAKAESLVEGNTEAIFKSMEAAMRDCTEANLIALGRIVRDEAMAYIAACHKDDVEYVEEETNARIECN